MEKFCKELAKDFFALPKKFEFCEEESRSFDSNSLVETDV